MAKIENEMQIFKVNEYHKKLHKIKYYNVLNISKKE